MNPGTRVLMYMRFTPFVLTKLLFTTFKKAELLILFNCIAFILFNLGVKKLVAVFKRRINFIFRLFFYKNIGKVIFVVNTGIHGDPKVGVIRIFNNFSVSVTV